MLKGFFLLGQSGHENPSLDGGKDGIRHGFRRKTGPDRTISFAGHQNIDQPLTPLSEHAGHKGCEGRVGVAGFKRGVPHRQPPTNWRPK